MYDQQEFIDREQEVIDYDREKLFDCQKGVYDDILNCDQNIKLLCGPAGTGKSFLVATYCRKRVGKNIIILAPTHKALKEIKDKINVSIELSTTIAAFFYKCKKYSSKGNAIFTFPQVKIINDEMTIDDELINKIASDVIKARKINQNTIILIDESSMMIEEEFFVFDDISKLSGCEIILIGDSYQLPPVGEDLSMVFQEELPMFKLEQIVRTDKPELSALYKYFRKVVEKRDISDFRKFLRTHSKVDVKVVYTKDKLLDSIENFSAEDKIISYSNKTVQEYNHMLRNKLYGKENIEEYLPGERVIFTDYFDATENGTFGKRSKEDLKIFMNNDEAVIKAVEKNKVYHESFQEHFMTFEITLMDGTKIFKIAKEEEDRYKKKIIDEKKNINTKISTMLMMKTLKDDDPQKLWKEFEINKNKLDAPINYAYACTVYKSQGSTYKNVYLDFANIFFCLKDTGKIDCMLRAMYTAVTRASDKIVLFIRPSMQI